MTFKRLAFVFIVLVLGAVIVFVIPKPDSVKAHSAKRIDRTIEMTWGDMFFQVKGQPKNAPVTVKAGEVVKFVIKNTGQVMHEMHIGRKVNLKDEVYDEPLFTEGYDTLFLDKGQAAELVLIIPNKPGEWELGCLHEGHYPAGMKAKLIIQPKS